MSVLDFESLTIMDSVCGGRNFRRKNYQEANKRKERRIQLLKLLNSLIDKKDYTSLKRARLNIDQCGMQQTEERLQRLAL